MDELNNLNDDFEVFMEEYFEAMDITEEQVEDRKEAARELRNLMLLLFLLILETLSRGYADYAFILAMFGDKLEEIAIRHGGDSDRIREYADKVSADIFSVTMLHVNPENADGNYFVSDERASLLAVNEANSIMNCGELQDAIGSGFTKKTWRAERDRKTRKEHLKMDGTTIPIEEYFKFPDCEMLYPHDEVNGTALECANCRCSLAYSK